MISVNKISFDECASYWKTVDHFQDPNKKILEFVETLGPYKTLISDPPRQAYGLFDESRLIGVTQLVKWSDEWLRYRTINIRREYRGKNLGWSLIEQAYNDGGWNDMPYLFGWTKKSHLNWALGQGFSYIDGQWHDDHIGMIKKMKGI